MDAERWHKVYLGKPKRRQITTSVIKPLRCRSPVGPLHHMFDSWIASHLMFFCLQIQGSSETVHKKNKHFGLEYCALIVLTASNIWKS